MKSTIRATGALLFVACAAFGLPLSQVLAQSPDPIPALLVQLESPDLASRESAFYALLGSASATDGPSSGDAIPSQITNLLSQYPADAHQIVLALTSLLAQETSDPNLGSAASNGEDEDDSDFYLDLLDAVASLNDPITIPSLAGAIGAGGMATSRLAAFGPSALDAVLAELYSSNVQDRDGAAFTLVTMLQPQYYTPVSDPTSLSKIRAGLELAVKSDTPPSKYSYMQAHYQSALASMGSSVSGDLNDDGSVGCDDLAIIKAAFGRRAGQPGFDIRADVNGDGVINILDLSMEARRTLPGTVCR